MHTQAAAKTSATNEEIEAEIHRSLSVFDFKTADRLYEAVMNRFGQFHVRGEDRDIMQSPILHKYEEAKSFHIRKFFEKHFPAQSDFDQEQLLAIASSHKNTLVSARAGSGKTKVIGGKIAFLIGGERIKPNDILTLTFNKKASEEIRDRVIDAERGFGIGDFHFAKTFHAIAYKIVNPQEDVLIDIVKYADPITGDEVEYDTRKHKLFIQDCFLSLFHERLEDMMRSHFPAILKNVRQTGLVSGDDDYLKKRIQDKYYSFSGDYVRSIGERFLLDFLVEYGFTDIRYEPRLDIGEDGQIDMRKPDVRCSREGIDRALYFEHWGSDASWKSNVPDFWDMTKDEYDRNKQKKQRYFRSKEMQGNLYFLETDIHDIRYGDPDGGRGCFFRKVKAMIEERFGIVLQKLDDATLVKRIKECSRDVIPFVKQIQQYIQRAQYQSCSPERMSIRIRDEIEEDDEKAYLTICNLVYERYEERKKTSGKIDFNELLERACTVIREKVGEVEIRFKTGDDTVTMNLNRLKYILIDEYQDFSPLFYKILEAIREYNPDYRLFVVGDDWQAINSFAGSDIRYFLEFKDMFFRKESVDTKHVSTNYRSTHSLVASANHLMEDIGGVPARPSANNHTGIAPVHIDLSDLPETFANDELIGHVLGARPADDEDWIRRKKVLMKIIHTIVSNPDRSLMILSRQNKVYGMSIFTWVKFLKRYFIETIRKAQQEKNVREKRLASMNAYFENRFEFLTNHRSKGKQADIVILLDASEKNYPSEEESLRKDSKYFRIFGDDAGNILRNEQKLFYVALTRAKKEFLIISEAKDVSGYVHRILG